MQPAHIYIRPKMSIRDEQTVSCLILFVLDYQRLC